MRAFRRVVSSHIVLESMTEPVVAAERMLKRAYADNPPPKATSSCPTPLRVAACGSDSNGVAVAVNTPPDVDAACVLRGALAGRSWSVESTGHSSSIFSAVLRTNDGIGLKLQVPHTVEVVSTVSVPMLGRPRLQAGSLVYEAPRLSMAMAKSIVAAANTAASKRDAPGARRQDGGPLAALAAVIDELPGAGPPADSASAGSASGDRAAASSDEEMTAVLSLGRRRAGLSARGLTRAVAPEPPPPSSAPSPPSAPSAPSPFYNAAAVKASVANADAWGEMSSPLGEITSPLGETSSASSRARPSSAPGVSSRLDPTRAASDHAVSPSEAVGLIAELGARVLMPEGGAVRADGWASLAGGEAVRVAVEEALLLPMRHPEVGHLPASPRITPSLPMPHQISPYLPTWPQYPHISRFPPFSHLFPPFPTFSHLLPPSPTFSHLR